MKNSLTLTQLTKDLTYMIVSVYNTPTINVSYDDGCDDNGFTPEGDYGDRRITVATITELFTYNQKSRNQVQEQFNNFVKNHHNFQKAKLYIEKRKDSGETIEKIEVAANCIISFI